MTQRNCTSVFRTDLPIAITIIIRKRGNSKNLIKRNKTQMYMHLHNRLLNMCKKHPRQFWRIVRPKKDIPLDVNPQILLEHFVAQNNMSTINYNGLAIILSSTLNVPELDSEICDDEVMQAIACLKSNRAPGIDGLPANSDFISVFILLFNHYPKHWLLSTSMVNWHHHSNT